MNPPNMSDPICAECAIVKGARWPEHHCATQWIGACSVCGEEKGVCAAGDWLWCNEDKIPAERWD